MVCDDPSLDRPLARFRDDLHRCVDLIIERYATLSDAPCHPGNAEALVRSWFDEPLPRAGADVDKLLDTVQERVMEPATLNIGTRMFAYVMSGGTQVSVMADLLASALDQNPAKWHLGPSMTEIERRVIAWTGEFIGLGDARGGAIVSGGSAANLTGLHVARNRYAERAGLRAEGLAGLGRLVTYTSDQAHASIDKSIDLLGLGTANLRRLAARPDGTLDPLDVRAAIASDRAAGHTPFCIVASAGTVNTGAVDPLDALADIAQADDLWFHVDGAYGGLASSLAELRSRYNGLARADSVALDYHKWLYQPFEVGCTLFRDWEELRRTFDRSAAYLDYGAAADRFDISRHHFALSRNAKAFKVWMSFKAYGADRFCAMIRKDIALARYLANIVSAAPDFELVTDAGLGIVCFRYCGTNGADGDALNRLNGELLRALEADGRVFITGTDLDGQRVLRACIINHRMAEPDIDYLIAVIREVAATRLPEG